MENKDLTQLVGKTIKEIMWTEDALPPQHTNLFIEFADGYKLLLAVDSFGFPDIQEPEGYNGPGMYETQTKAFEMNFLDGHKYVLTVDGEKTHPQFATVRFNADSLKHAKSRLNLDEVEYVKWVSAWPTTNNE